MSNVSLEIGFKIYEFWQKVNIVRGLDAISGSFEVTVTGNPAIGFSGEGLYPGQPVIVSVDGEKVITGFLDDVDVIYGPNKHEFTLRGRDVTGLLVDCAADRGTTQFEDKTLTQICNSICSLFKVPVIAMTDIGQPFKKVSVQQGEKVFTLIDRLCRNRAVIPFSDGLGNLILTRTGTVKAGRLELGVNILEGSIKRSWRQQFSEYLVKGQAKSAPSLSAKAHTHPKAQATDPALAGTFRPFTLIAETQGSDDQFKDRANFEANRRAGKSLIGNHTVQGWRTGGNEGPLWQPNTLVDVADRFGNIHREMLISSVTFKKDDKGTVSLINIARPEAYERFPLPKETKQGLAG